MQLSKITDHERKQMLVKTKHFGEVDLDESKIIYFEQGILGFSDCKKLHNYL